MVIIKEGKTYIKILYWGMGGSGKTTIVDTLHRLPEEQRRGIEPIGNLTKIAKASGATLYFDRGIFQSTKTESLFYHVFTVAGQNSYTVLRKKIFDGTDGVIFVVDSQTHFFEDNIDSLRELIHVSRGKLINEIPLIINLNKQDLTEVISEEDFMQVLKEQNLWHDTNNKLSIWNPIIYKTCALFDKQKEIFHSFSECARRTYIYQKSGNGKAPIEDNQESIIHY